MMILSRVCVDFRDRRGKTLFSVTPSDLMVLREAPEAIRDDPIFDLLLAEGSMEVVVSADRRKALENDPVQDTDASGKRIAREAGEGGNPDAEGEDGETNAEGEGEKSVRQGAGEKTDTPETEAGGKRRKTKERTVVPAVVAKDKTRSTAAEGKEKASATEAKEKVAAADGKEKSSASEGKQNSSTAEGKQNSSAAEGKQKASPAESKQKSSAAEAKDETKISPDSKSAFEDAIPS